MSTIYRDDMVEIVARECKLPKSTVKKVIIDYTDYIYKETSIQHTVKFLHLFYIENKENKDHETFAYVCTEIAKEKEYNGKTVQNVLETYEQCLLDELLNGKGISIYGVAKVYTVPKLRIRKTGRLANKGYRVKATKWMRDKVNNYDRKNT